MSSWRDRLLNPMRAARNARWKTGALARAARTQFGPQPPWIVARNRRREVVHYGPPNIYIEPTNACNLKCPMCPTGLRVTERPRGFMSLDLARKIIGEVRHQPLEFGFWLAGEPLLHPEIVEMVTIAARAGLKPSMHTNATRLTRELAEGLVRAGLDWVSISFDGDNQEDYERLRPPAIYEETVENVRVLLKVRKELGSPTPRVILQTLIPYENEQTHPLGFRAKPSERFLAQYGDLRPDETRAILANAWTGTLEGRPGVAPNLRDTGRRWVCAIPWRDMTIAWNGDLVTCCGDLDAKNVLDNVREKTIYDAWNGEGYRRFRRAMTTPEIEKWALCGKCERIWTVKPHPLDYPYRLEMLRYRLRF